PPRGRHALLTALRDEGVEIVGEVHEFEYGKFVHIVDLEGNRVELWGPDDEAYAKMVAGKTTS
ncbi:MAG: VOC family protein, partial [Planctomycetota bacterium]